MNGVEDYRPPEELFARLKRWFFDDDRISTGLGLLLFAIVGALASLLFGFGAFYLGVESLVREFVLVSTFTLLASVSGLGLLLRQGWARPTSLGVVVTFVVYTVAKIVFVPGEGLTLFRFSVLLLGLIAIMQLPKMIVTKAEEETAEALAALKKALLAHAQGRTASSRRRLRPPD